MGLLLASENPLALDTVAGAIMGLRKADNPLLLAAEQRGLGPVDLDQVELIGLDKTELPVPGYRLPPAPKGNMVGLPAALNPLVDLARRALSATPRMTGGLRGLRHLRRLLPGEGHRREEPPGPNQHRQVYPLLLLPRAVPPQGRGAAHRRTVPPAAGITRKNARNRLKRFRAFYTPWFSALSRR